MQEPASEASRPIEAPSEGLSARPRRSWRRSPAVLAAGLVLLLLVVYLVLGAVVGLAASGDSEKALRGTIDHGNSVVQVLNEDPLKGMDLSASTADIPKAKAALAAYKEKLARVAPTVRSDRSALRAVRPRLNASPLTLPEQSLLSRNRQRVEAALSALQSAQRGIDISAKQVDFLTTVFDAAASFDAVGKSMQANDISGTAAGLDTTEANIKRALSLAQPPDVPTAFQPLLNAMQKATDDLQGLVAAIQAKDNTAVQKYLAAVKDDGKALETTDQNAIDQAESDLFQPLIDSYNREMKIAAG